MVRKLKQPKGSCIFWENVEISVVVYAGSYSNDYLHVYSFCLYYNA